MFRRFRQDSGVGFTWLLFSELTPMVQVQLPTPQQMLQEQDLSGRSVVSLQDLRQIFVGCGLDLYGLGGRTLWTLRQIFSGSKVDWPMILGGI